ncbi:MAG: hypothetical protein ACP5HQ_06855 [Thermoprotei archaeon]
MRLYDLATWVATVGSLSAFLVVTVWVAVLTWDLGTEWRALSAFLVAWSVAFLLIGVWLRLKKKRVIF